MTADHPDRTLGPHRPARTVGIVGLGTMGAGIAQVILEAGDAVVASEADPVAASRGLDRIRAALARRAARGSGAAEPVETTMARCRSVPTLEAVGQACDIVIEAVLEDLQLKRAVFQALAAAAAPETILASNTSALRIADLATDLPGAYRIVGLHWFNPATRMLLVEVVPGPLTSPDVLERATAAVIDWGRTPIRSADTPGFIVNRVNRPFTIEALRLLEAGEAGVEAIDGAIRDAGFPMGPFELMDLAGLDVNLAAARSVWEGLGRPEHLRPSPIQERLVERGHLGRKTGIGFHRYDEAGHGIGVAPAFAHGPTTQLDPAAIARRITAAIVAERDRAVEAGVASRDAIDLALRLGAGHPVRSST